MTANAKTFDMRLVAYTPLGARGAVIPDLGFSIASTPGAPTLSAQVSTAIYGTLPTDLEVAVEWWNAKTNAWAEGRDSRFAITQFEADDRDPNGVVTLTGIGIGAFLLGAAALGGVAPYTATNVRSEAAAASTISVSGSTFTWASHVLAAGDRVKITAKGNAKNINTGSIYYVRNTTASTFQISATPTGAIKSCGTASNVGVSRVCTRIVFNSGSHQFTKSQAVSVTGGTAIGLTDGSVYYVVNPTPATIQIADNPGGIPIELSTANTAFTNIYRNLDGQRVFTNATPGTVMDAVFLEARNRGWGIGQDGSTQMLHGWTTTVDSVGAPWTALANDPSTPGVGLGFQPGTPGTQVLQALLDNAYAEWYTSNGRTIHLVNYGTGNDKTTDSTTYTGANTVGPTPEISITPATTASVMQDFVRVPSTGHYFVSQIVNESNGVESTRISRLNSSGVLIDQMIANGGGHGTSIEIEVISGVENVWMTWAAANATTGTAVDNNVVRFPWPTGLTTAATRFDRTAVTGLVTKIAGAGTYRNVSFDWINNLALVRASSGSTDTYQLHSVTNVQAGNLTSPQSTLTLSQSTNFGVDGKQTVQGFATFKGSLFRYTGAPSDTVGGDPFTLTEYRWSDGVPVRVLNLSGVDKTNGAYPGGKGEPEGMSLYDLDGSAPKLYLGINTGPTGGPHGYDLFALPLNTTSTTTGTVSMRIGTTASALKVQTDLTDMRNAITVRGVGNVIQTVSGSTGPWGRLEMYETAPGATSNSLANKQGTNDLSANGSAAVAYTVTELAQESAWLPLADYSRGDWIAVQLSTNGWSKLRCVGWAFQKASNGVITVTTNLARIKQTLIAKMATKSTKQIAGLSQTSTPGASLVEDDNRKAASPLGVTTTTLGNFANDGAANAIITVAWLPVTQDINGGDLAIDEYEVWIRPEGAPQGQPVGQTHGLTLDAGPYPSNQTYGVSVRAKSSSGQWGELSAEVEVTTAYPVTIPNPPTTPTVSGKLGAVRVAWDGNLVDPTLGNTAPEPGFAYVYAAYSTSLGGTYIPAGTNMGNAGYTPITGLTIGTTYWFALFAVNTIGTVSAMSAVASFTVVGVTGPDIQANSVTANTIAAGAITADKLDIGTVPQGTPTNRVPMPLTATSFWTLALTGATTHVVYTNASNAAAGSTGITLTSSAAVGTFGAFCWLTQQNADVASGVIHLSGLTTGGIAVFRVREWTNVSTNTFTDTTVSISPAGAIYNLQAPTVAYGVWVGISGPGTDTLSQAYVFEGIGTAGGAGQAAQLTPSGLRLYDGTGHLAMDLTTATQQFINIYDNTGADPQAVASVDSGGNATFAEISGDGFDLNGLNFTDETDSSTLSQSTPNNSSFGSLPLLDRLARGPIYDVTWNTLNSVNIASGTQYMRVAQDQFTLEDGRQYQFVVQTGGVQVNNGGGVNCYLELQVNLTPNTSVQSGTIINRASVFGNPQDQGYWALPPVVYTASASQTTIDTTNRILPAGVPIYWQVNFNMSTAPTAALALTEFGNSRGLTVIDIGASALVRPTTGIDALANVTDRTTTGASTGTTSGGTTATSTTKTFTAAWSRTWNNSGSTIVSGTGTYTNGAAMYQGNGASAMGSKFGFAALGLTGKTITAMSLYLYASYFAYSGKSALLGTHGDTAAPATYTGARANAWSAGWSGGSGKWVTVPSSLWAGFAAGTYRGFSLGVDGADANYAYFRGATQGNPPQIKITYH